MRKSARWIPIQVLALVAAGCSVGIDDDRDESGNELSAKVMRVESEEVSPDRSEPVAQPASFRLPESEIAASEAPLGDDGVDHAREGRLAWEAGDPALAARELRIAVDRGEASDYDIYLLGLSLWKSGDLDAAAAVLADAVWRLDHFVKAPVNLARVRLSLGETDPAEEAVRKALEIDPDYGPAHNVLGRVLLARGLGDEAAAAFRRAAELSDADPWPHNNLGYLMLVEGRHEEAIAPLEQAIAIDEGLAVAWHNLALAQERAGELVAAAAAASRAETLASSEAYSATAARLASLTPDGAVVTASTPSAGSDPSDPIVDADDDTDASAASGDAVAETATLGEPATR